MINLAIHKLKRYLEIIPVLLFLFNVVMYVWFCLHRFKGVKMIDKNLYWALKHFSETTVFFTILLIYISIKDRWHPIPKICSLALFLLWINNIPPIVFNSEPQLYFFIFATIIYVTSLILSLAILTRRWIF